MNNLVKTTILISELEQGMTVEHNGQLVTVSKNDIKYHDLFGCSFKGDMSKQEITRIQFAVPTAKGLILR